MSLLGKMKRKIGEDLARCRGIRVEKAVEEDDLHDDFERQVSRFLARGASKRHGGPPGRKGKLAFRSLWRVILVDESRQGDGGRRGLHRRHLLKSAVAATITAMEMPQAQAEALKATEGRPPGSIGQLGYLQGGP